MTRSHDDGPVRELARSDDDSLRPSPDAHRRLRVLISAFSCRPGFGSEPGVGWNISREMAECHDVWVLTHHVNQGPIEAELSRNPLPGLTFIYVGMPRLLALRKLVGPVTSFMYQYAWQLKAYAVARRLARAQQFDLIHHVTLGKCWSPSFLALLPIPFLWGPVGGAESAPKSFWRDFGVRGIAFEATRESARWLVGHDRFTRLTAQRSRMALAKTDDTAEWIRRRGSRSVRVYSEAALPSADLEKLTTMALPDAPEVRFISMGNLLHLKGFHLALRAFAASGLDSARYWILGDGPELGRLERIARELGIAERVHFWGRLDRADALEQLGAAHVLVHPSLHDSGGWVCVEAMAAARPVICLDIGGPATQVSDGTGMKIPARSPRQAVADIAAAMRTLAEDPELRRRMGQSGRDLVRREYTWLHKRETLSHIYEEVAAGQIGLRSAEHEHDSGAREVVSAAPHR